VIPVAILTTDTFDATTVDPTTVDFEGASAVHQSVEDVDGDGDLDLIMHFRSQETAIADAATEACLTGETFGGQPIAGCDAIRIVPPWLDSDGDGFGDAIEATLGTDQFAACSVDASHDAWPPDFDHDTDADPGDLLGLFFFSMNQSAGEPFHSKRADFDGDGDNDVGDLLGGFFFFMNTKCAVFTFTNNTGSAVDDITITFSAALVQASSALDSDVEGWGPGTLSAGATVLDLDRPDGEGALRQACLPAGRRGTHPA
jgi:hypothetical protein